MGRLLVMGDCHGDVEALHQVLERANVTSKDTLISLGDVCDGFRRTRSVIDTLLTLNLILIRANHDSSAEGCGPVVYGWMLGWMMTGTEVPLHYHQGGMQSMESYGFDHKNVPQSHIDFLKSAVPYYIKDNKIFVHGGFDPLKPIESQDPEFLMWDRKLCVLAQYNPIQGYDKVFVGHTCVRAHGATDFLPRFYNNLVMMDTGCGWLGKLTIMDTDTLEFWQSDMRDINDPDHNLKESEEQI